MADTLIGYDELLGNPVITGLVSRVDTPIARLSSFYGLEPGGPYVEQWPGKLFTWDIRDRSRNIAQARAPYAGPSAITQHPVGRNMAHAVRLHEKIPILDEKIYRTRGLGQSYGTVDTSGMRYVAEQASYMAERLANAREFMVSRMFRGGVFYLQEEGDDWKLTDNATNADSGANVKVDYGVPDENKSRIKDLDGTTDILTDWNQSTAAIHDQCLRINARMERDLGAHPLRHVWINSKLANAIMTNDDSKDVAGTANIVYNQYRPDGMQTDQGNDSTGLTFTLKVMPWLTFHVYDGGLNTIGDSFGTDFSSFTQTIPDDYAIFTPDPSSDLYKRYEGSELVREHVMDPGSERYGLAAWTEPVTQPAGRELITLDITLPVTFRPLSIFYGYVGA